jgi:hypothetical protein
VPDPVAVLEALVEVLLVAANGVGVVEFDMGGAVDVDAEEEEEDEEVGVDELDDVLAAATAAPEAAAMSNVPLD